MPPGIQNESYAAVIPDRLQSFYETPAFRKLGLFESQIDTNCFNENCCLTHDGKVIAGYAWVLGQFFNLNIRYEYPLIYSTFEKTTGLEKHYRIRIFSWFCEMHNTVPIKKLTHEEKKRIFENLDNPNVLPLIDKYSHFIT